MREKSPTLNTQNDSIPAKLFLDFSHSLVYPRLIYSNVLSHSIFFI